MELSLLSAPSVRKYRDALFHLVFPRNCLLCDTDLNHQEKGICRKCSHKLPYTKFEFSKNNAVDQLFWGKVKIERAMAMLFFRKGERPQKILHHIKYRKAKDLGISMGEILGKRLVDAHFLDDIDVIIPVPLHPRRLKHRGYNQSELIAQGITKVTGIKLIPNAIVRQSHTETQTKKSRYERHENVHRVFVIPNTKPLEGRHVLLIDDVVTTGSTLEACASQLANIQNIKISVAALAFAVDF